MNKNRKSSIIGIVITIIVLIILVVVTNNNLIHLEGIASKIVMPIQNGLTYLKNKVTGNNEFFSDIKNLKAENEQLKQTNKELEEKLRELEILRSENEMLKEYANLTEKYSEYSTIPAYIINKNVSNFSDNIVINVGSNDGVEPNMCVISEKGLVGYIVSTTDTTAKVQTIVDTSTSVSASVTTTRDSIICKGMLDSSTTLKATYIPIDATLAVGDNVETSGMGGIYPRGITIGKIKEIVNTKNIANRYAIIETAVDFSKIETVLVIK